MTEGKSSMDFIDLGPVALFRLGAVVLIAVLLFLLIMSFISRSKVFCQYLKHMTGISLKPGTVRAVYKKRGRGGVRDYLIDLLIREDLADPNRVVTPDSKPDISIFEND